MGADVGLLAASVAGLLSFLSPCVLPLVPPYLCFVTGTSLNDLTEAHGHAGLARRAFTRALAFVLGFSAVFIALGASASLVGRLIGDHLDVLTRLAGVIVVLLGLHMLGVFRVLFLMRDTRVHVARQPTSLVGAFVVGLAFAFGWTPCVGPVLASVLIVAGAGDSIGVGAGLLAAYAAGLGVPFLLVALFTAPFLRWFGRFRRHSGTVEKVMGMALVATGVVIFVGAMPMLAGWLLEAAPILGRIG
jgi:cytochrome c-type biogenesis protein